MAGVRSRPLCSGRYQGWYLAYVGTGMPMQRKFFTGTHDRRETLRIAQRLEDEQHQINLNYRPAPKVSEKHQNRPLAGVTDEYLAWGESRGGRGGRPWGRKHAIERRRFLTWWIKRLGLEVVNDLVTALPRVDQTLHVLEKDGRTGKTLQQYADGLAAFCRWCVERGYLEEDPLKSLGAFDTSPKFVRRAMTPEEIHNLLKTCAPHRRLVYEVAFCSGLRANELRSLEFKHLEVESCGLRLEPSWTKNRKPGFQPLSKSLVKRLQMFHRGGTAKELYRSFNVKGRSVKSGVYKTHVPSDPLLYVPSHPARDFKQDLEVAGIPVTAPGGRLDFHACRVAYTTFVFDAGATVKEAQALVRHRDPNLTANVYGRTRDERLHEVAENVGRILELQPKSHRGRRKRSPG